VLTSVLGLVGVLLARPADTTETSTAPAGSSVTAG
jgi:hypothetical protein